MSGGHFNYTQYTIGAIADDIEAELERQGKEKEKDELYMRKEFYEEYPEERYYTKYPEEVEKIMKDGVKALRIAHIYAQRIDWYLSGDDDEESLIRRLDKELKELENE